MPIEVYICNGLGLLAFIAALLTKGKKMGLILFLNFAGNTLMGVAYLLGGNGINGALSSFLGGLLAIITYFFDAKEKSLPKWLIAVYAVSFLAVNLFGGAISWFTALALGACMCYIMALLQKSGKIFRFWSLSNSAIWCIYDFCTQSYGSLAVHIVLLVIAIVGMIVHDRKKQAKNQEG